MPFMGKTWFPHNGPRDKDQKAIVGDVTINISSEVEKILGYTGAMLSGSKVKPKGCEDHTIFWNACVFTEDGKEIWFGDLDLTAKEEDLQKVADLVGKIYVTREHPFRWHGLKEGLKQEPYGGMPEYYIYEKK